jgi:glutamine amidotransferase PdxT
MPFKGAYMFRPGAIQPLHGITSKTPSYRVMYAVLGPLLPLARKVFPSAVTDTETLGRAMIAVARNGYGKQVLESTDINAVPRT